MNSPEGSKESTAVVAFVLFAMIAAVCGVAALVAYGQAQKDVRIEWCQSLGGQASGDLCVKGNEVVLRWDD